MKFIVSPDIIAYGILVEVYLILLFSLYALVREIFRRYKK